MSNRDAKIVLFHQKKVRRQWDPATNDGSGGISHHVIPGRKPGIYFTCGFPRSRE